MKKHKPLMSPSPRSLRSLFPQVAAEWDSLKNGDLNPDNVTAYSNKKVWWICPKGHEYEMVVSKRTARNQGCPFCSGKRVTKATSFGSLFPQLVLDWDIEKNGSLSPFELSAHSNRKVWWKCSLGHSYQRSVSGKTHSPLCPYCSGIKPTKETSLAATDPELLLEWDYEKNGTKLPEDYLRGSHQKVWWKCPSGHSYCAPIQSRSIAGTGCPQCDAEKRTSFPEQAIGYYLERTTTVLYRYKIDGHEADLFLPTLSMAIEYDGAYYHGRAESGKRDAAKNAFFAAKGILLIRVKEFKQKRVEEYGKTEWGYRIPAPYSQTYIFIGDIMRQIAEIILQERGVKFDFDVDISRDRGDIVKRYSINRKENSVAVKKPIGIKKWDHERNGGVDPYTIPVSSKKRFFWLCPTCGYRWEGAVENLADTLTCPKCVHANERSFATDAVSGFSLEDLLPSLAAEWHPTKNGGLRPSDVTPGSNKKVWWKCSKCGNEWQAIVKTRAKGYGCKKCSYDKRRVTTVAKRGTLFDQCPGLLEQWDFDKNQGVDIKLVAPSSRQQYWWKCPNGHSYLSSPIVKRNSHGCPFCSGRRVDKNASLKIQDPQLASLWDYQRNTMIGPESVSPNSGKSFWFTCPICGESFFRRVQSMHQSSRCPLCKKPFRKKSR